jgi:hypothetical protein
VISFIIFLPLNLHVLNVKNFNFEMDIKWGINEMGIKCICLWHLDEKC